MGEQVEPNDSGITIPSSEGENAKFTTTDFIDKIKETLMLASEIQRHPAAKQNDKIQTLIKLQCANTLQLLSTLNQNERNPLARDGDFGRVNFSDAEKFALLSDINDSIVDKTIHYTERVKNIKEGKQDLIEVHAKLSTNFSRIELHDFNKRKSNATQISTPTTSPASSLLKRKYNSEASPRTGEYPAKRVTFLASANVPRPQTVYRMKVDNSYSTPFIPRLTKKPNSTASTFQKSTTPIAYPNAGNVPNTRDESSQAFTGPSHFYPHPYQHEIEQFEVQMDFLDRGTESDQAQLNGPPKVEEMKPFQLIQTREQLKALVETLKKYSEISVDVEHHSFRTYQGITSLVQISTDDSDYIVDVFPLWNDMEHLNEIFTSPSILKIFHGADYDIIWLQRDLGLYVVNMFDTGLAAKLLNYSHISLSYLVTKFCDFQLDKRFQLADWRIRPIPEEMLNYARYDTHFLLYIYRKLKQELLAKGDESSNLLRVVMDKSRDLCLKRYEKKLIEPNDHFNLIWKNNLKFNGKQLAALKSLYTWRDLIARNEDESTGYVLPNNLLLKICEILPREQQGILACCNPIPPLVRQHINEIHKLILDARSKQITDSEDTRVNQSSELSGTGRRSGRSTIDLSNDRRIDNHSTGKGHSNHSILMDHSDAQLSTADDDMIVPLLSWSEGAGKFELSRQSEEGKMEIEQKPKKTNSKKEESINEISNMFTSNMAMYIEKAILARKKKAQVDKLFDTYVSPFQRYLNAVELKKQEQEK